MTAVSLEGDGMEEKEISVFITMLRRTSLCQQEGSVCRHVSLPKPCPSSMSRGAKTVPYPGSGSAGCLCRGYMIAAPLLAPAAQRPCADPPEDKAAERDVTSSH